MSRLTKFFPNGILREAQECTIDTCHMFYVGARDTLVMHVQPGYSKSRNGEMRNEKLEMRKWKWSSLDKQGSFIAMDFMTLAINVCTSSTHLVSCPAPP